MVVETRIDKLNTSSILLSPQEKALLEKFIRETEAKGVRSVLTRIQYKLYTLVLYMSYYSTALALDRIRQVAKQRNFS